MIYFLGGPPRVGKSIIARTITSKRGINVVSTDSLGAVLENVLDPELEPGLFIVNRFNEMCVEDRIDLMVKNTAERINYQIEENRAVWKAVVPFVQRERDEGRDVVVEGVAVLPELVNQLENVDFRAVFIGNQGNEHKENIKRSAQEIGHDWMREASDQYVEAFAVFVMEMSRYIEREAHIYGFNYIEISGRPFDDAVYQIVDSLLER
jgi:2-phosphoglycerate kinase